MGTGALTLPAGFAKAGWLLSLVVISLLALISYMTVTFVVEALAAANAVKTWQNLQVQKRSYYDVGIIQSNYPKYTFNLWRSSHNQEFSFCIKSCFFGYFTSYLDWLSRCYSAWQQKCSISKWSSSAWMFTNYCSRWRHFGGGWT